MNIAQAITILALALLSVAALLAKNHLRQRRGLRLIFIGLLMAAACAVAISFSPLLMARLLALPMMAGMVLVLRGIHVENNGARKVDEA